MELDVPAPDYSRTLKFSQPAVISTRFHPTRWMEVSGIGAGPCPTPDSARHINLRNEKVSCNADSNLVGQSPGFSDGRGSQAGAPQPLHN